MRTEIRYWKCCCDLLVHFDRNAGYLKYFDKISYFAHQISAIIGDGDMQIKSYPIKYRPENGPENFSVIVGMS